MKVERPDGAVIDFVVDEHPRRDTTAERLAALPVLHPQIEGFSITAGNSSGINDAAATVPVVDADYGRRPGWRARCGGVRRHLGCSAAGTPRAHAGDHHQPARRAQCHQQNVLAEPGKALALAESSAWAPEERWQKQIEAIVPVFLSPDATEGPLAFAEKRSPN